MQDGAKNWKKKLKKYRENIEDENISFIDVNSEINYMFDKIDKDDK